MGRSLRRARAAIFDVDGTLLDSIDAYLGVTFTCWEQVGLPPPQTSVLLEIIADGTPFWSAWPRLVPAASWSDEELKARCMQIQRQLWRDRFGVQVRLVPGAVAVLQGLRRAGLATGICTSSLSFVIAEPFAREGYDLSSLVDAIVTREDVCRTKPAPAPLLLCAGLLGLPPSHCLYVGDAPVDVVAGQAAGIHTVAVLTGAGTRETLAPLCPDAILESVVGLPALLDLRI